MSSQLELEARPALAPDPWPAMRAKHEGKPLARRIFVDRLEQEWIEPAGELAAFHDGATMFVYTPARPDSPDPLEQAAIVDQFNLLWQESSQREQRA